MRHLKACGPWKVGSLEAQIEREHKAAESMEQAGSYSKYGNTAAWDTGLPESMEPMRVPDRCGP